MPKVTNYDVLTFFYCILAGVALSVLCDIFRALRKYMKLGKAAVFAVDFLFFVIAALVTFYMQFIYSNGGIRFYILFGEICGFLAARCTLSPLNNMLFLRIYRIIRAIVRPIKCVISAIYRKTLAVCKKICKKMLVFEKNILKSVGGLVYNVFNMIFRKNAKIVHKSKIKAEKSGGKKKKKRQIR